MQANNRFFNLGFLHGVQGFHGQNPYTNSKRVEQYQAGYEAGLKYYHKIQDLKTDNRHLQVFNKLSEYLVQKVTNELDEHRQVTSLELKRKDVEIARQTLRIQELELAAMENDRAAEAIEELSEQIEGMLPPGLRAIIRHILT